MANTDNDWSFTLVNDSDVTRALMSGVISAPGLYRVNMFEANTISRQLRDEWLFEFPILPAAVQTYIQVAVSREWTITGSPRRAAKAVETLNDARFMDSNGEVHFGWEAFQTRRVLDWITTGRNAFLYPKSSYLQYVDPLDILYVNNIPDPRDRVLTTRNDRYKTRKIFKYLERDWNQEELFLNYAFPVGANGINPSPLLSVLPTARMAFLVREHDMARADGRKLRDIFIVADNSMREAFAEAIKQSVLLWNGASPEKIGVGIVSAGADAIMDVGVNVNNMFARLGLADIPENFNRTEFWLDYAQEVAAALDLPLRSFWNDPRGSNRSLEKVTQERARRQGPAYYILTEQRLLNNSGILGDRVRFQFIEEVDTSLLKDNAEIAFVYAQAIEKLKAALPELSGKAVMSWMQHMGILPRDEDLVKEIATLTEDKVQAEDMIDGDMEQLLEEQGKENLESELEVKKKQQEALQPQVQPGAPGGNKPPAQQQQQKKKQATQKALSFFQRYFSSNFKVKSIVPDYGEVVLDSSGNVIEHRNRVFQIGDYFEQKTINGEVDAGITKEEYKQEVNTALDRVLADLLQNSAE